MKSILCAAVAALTLVGGSANAASIGYSFSNVIGDVAGTVTGHIDGLDPNGTSSATAVFVDSYPTALVQFGSYPTPFNVLDWVGGTIGENSFTLAGGVFVSGAFFISGANGDFDQLFINSACCGGPDTNYLDIGSNNDLQVWNDNGVGSAGITFTAATIDAVPEPATLALFGLGLAGLGVARRRRA